MDTTVYKKGPHAYALYADSSKINSAWRESASVKNTDLEEYTPSKLAHVTLYTKPRAT